MSYRLTIDEFEFLKDGLKALEGIGQKMLLGERPNEPAVNFFLVGRAEIAGKVEKLQRLRNKIEKIAGD